MTSIFDHHRVRFLLHLNLQLCLSLFLCLYFSFSGYAQAGMTMEQFSMIRIDTIIHSATPLLISQHPIHVKVRAPYVSQAFTSKPQPFFCRIETQIERRSGIAARFRLGSVDYTNWLEGKNNFRE